MTWGRVAQDGGIEPVTKPEKIDPTLYEDKDRPPPSGLAELNAAIEEAESHQLPGSPSALTPTISVSNFEPTAGALNSALDGHGY